MARERPTMRLPDALLQARLTFIFHRCQTDLWEVRKAPVDKLNVLRARQDVIEALRDSKWSTEQIQEFLRDNEVEVVP